MIATPLRLQCIKSLAHLLCPQARWLDHKHVVFGKVIQGFNVVETIGNLPTNLHSAKPEHHIKIVDCGVRQLDRKYDLTEDQLDMVEDL